MLHPNIKIASLLLTCCQPTLHGQDVWALRGLSWRVHSLPVAHMYKCATGSHRCQISTSAITLQAYIIVVLRGSALVAKVLKSAVRQLAACSWKCHCMSLRAKIFGRLWLSTEDKVCSLAQYQTGLFVRLLVLTLLLIPTSGSLVPRPAPFFVLWFAFSILHGSRRAWKTGKAWSHPSHVWRQVDASWTRKWH